MASFLLGSCREFQSPIVDKEPSEPFANKVVKKINKLVF